MLKNILVSRLVLLAEAGHVIVYFSNFALEFSLGSELVDPNHCLLTLSQIASVAPFSVHEIQPPVL